jgi:hypothetical protein
MRRVSGLERIWLAARQVAPPFANQLVLEGRGTLSPPQGWDAAFEALAKAQPGCRARLGGVLGGTRWRADGALPALRILDGSGWNGMGSEGAPFLDEPIDPARGPLYEVLVLEGEPSRVVLRTLNANTDGTGMLLFARGLFATLRGEPPLPADAGPMDDLQLARSLGVNPIPPPPSDSASPTGAADLSQEGVTWLRTRVGRARDVVPSLAVALGQAVAEHGPPQATCRVDVPVDLRRWAPQQNSTASLSGWMQLPVHLHLGAEDPVQAVRWVMRDALQRKAAASHALGAGFARSLPLGVLGMLGRRLARQSLQEGRYATSAVISHMGRIDPADFSGGGFEASRAFFVPSGSPGQPAFITTMAGPEGIELCLAMPRALASRGRLTALLDRLRRGLIR